MQSDLSQYRDDFVRYTDRFRDVPDAAPLRLKVEHTFRVCDHACRILDTLDDEPCEALRALADGEACQAARLAALFHDCGRFPQFEQYRTFLDAASVDHAVLSFRTMRDEGFLRGESDRVKRLANCAVLLHNKHILPSKLDAHARFVTDIVRDADKLDIFRIMVGYLTCALPEKDAVLLHVVDAPDRWSEKVVGDVMAGRVARYADLRYVNDFRLLLGTWMDELRFAATRKALADSGLMEKVLGALPDAAKLRPALDILHAKLERCRNEGRRN